MRSKYARQIRYGILSARCDQGWEPTDDQRDFYFYEGADRDYTLDTRLEYRAYNQTLRSIAQRNDRFMREFMDWVHGIDREDQS